MTKVTERRRCSGPCNHIICEMLKCKFGQSKVAVDYCSDRLYSYFLRKREDHISRKERRIAHCKHNSYDSSSEPSTSSQPSRVRHSDLLRDDEDSTEGDHQEDETSNDHRGAPNRVIADSSDNEGPLEVHQNGASNNSSSESESESESESGSGSSSSSDDENSDDNEEDHNVPGPSQRKDEPEKFEASDAEDYLMFPSTTTHPHSSSPQHQDSPERDYDQSSRSPLFHDDDYGSPYEIENLKPEVKSECSPSTSSPRYCPEEHFEVDLPENNVSRMLEQMQWKDPNILTLFAKRVDELCERNLKARVLFEKCTGRPFPKFLNEDELKPRKYHLHDSRSFIHENNTSHEMEQRIREWRRLSDLIEIEDYRAIDPEKLQREPPVQSTRSVGRPSLDESRFTRMSFDSQHHPIELGQRSHSLSVGPMTPATPYPTTMPLLVNTSQQHGTSQPSTSGVTTPRSSHAPNLMSPVSRHNSVSSVGKPANIQSLRHQSMVFLPDLSVPPPLLHSNSQHSASHDESMNSRDAPPSRRSSETMVPLKSPPFANQIPNLCTMQIPPPPHMIAATSTHSVSSSAHSTPRHSFSGTPVHYEPPTTKINQPPTPKSSKPEKLQVRHDSISKPGPSNAANALQARSQSMSGDPKKSSPSTPVIRDAGSDLIAQIMSNQPPSMGRKLPRIEKKPSALQNVHNQQSQPNSNHVPTPVIPSNSHQAMLLKDKEKEKERRRKERELEREREARKEMKRKETKEERHKRKEMERAKREEEERRERKREKQKKKEKEERRKEKEKERKKAEKEKLKKKKHRKDEGSDESGSTSDDDIDSGIKKPNKELTQEEKDHQLAVILSKGSIIDNLKSRRRSDKRNDLVDTHKNSGTRRVLIESSDDDSGDGDDDGKDKSDSSSGEASDTEKRFIPPTPVPSTPAPTAPTVSVPKEAKPKVQKEREKGELSSSSEDEENKHHQEIILQQQRFKNDRENRKRQNSLTNYSSDEHGERKTAPKRVKREDNEDVARQNAWGTKEEKNQRKRKLVHRRSSEDESRRKAKQQDFYDIPHEDVSDEEEVEEPSRVRRQPSASTTSNKDTHGKKEKGPKTPLRVVTPAGTPLLSPKVLSPKILSPKTSSTSMKRPSISDQESLISPRFRNRTTSSTSTATTASSKHETSSIPDKQLSPSMTAKSSVSSIDEFSIRDELNSNSAVGSPINSTGRPMVLTKAAMKAFNSSPPKKQSSSSGPHDSSSGSSSSTSSSDGSTSSSSDDSSDDETLIQRETSVETPCDLEKSNGAANDDIVVEVQPEPASIEAQPAALSPFAISEQSTESEAEPIVSSARSPTPLSVDVSKSSDDEIKAVDSIIQEEEKIASDSETNTILEVEDSQNQDSDQTIVEPESPTKTMVVEPEAEAEKEPIVEAVKTVIPESPPFPKQMEQDSVSQNVAPSPHTIISDQETDQAVQSIFDEEEADEFPQYPDIAKEVPAKTAISQETTDKQESMEKGAQQDYRHTNGHSEHAHSPGSSRSKVSEKTVSRRESVKSSSVEIDNESPLSEATSSVSPDVTPMVVDTEVYSDDDDDKGLTIVESPEQTPTPELITDEKVVEIVEEPSRVEEATPNENLAQKTVPAQAPLQPHVPLEISVSQNNQQVIQPSPRPAFTPVPQQHSGQPVSVVQQSRIDSKPTTMAHTPVPPETFLMELWTNGNADELADILTKYPELKQSMNPQMAQMVQNMLLHHTPQSQSVIAHQNQDHDAHKTAEQKQRELQENQRNDDQRRKEELERKRQVDRMEKKRRSEERMNLAAAQKAAKKPQDSNGRGFHGLIPNDALAFLNQNQLSRIGIGSIQQLGGFNGQANGIQYPGFVPQQLLRPPSASSTSSNSARSPFQPSTTVNRPANELPQKEEFQVQRWFYNHLQAAQAAQHVPVVTAAPNPLEALLSTASLANLATGGALNPLSMLALTSSLNQSSPVYQGIARVLLTMNMGQMLATHQTSELLATMNQQDTLMALLAARNGLPFPFPQQNQQQQAPSQGGFAVPQMLPHMSLKRANKDSSNVGGSDRKKSCPPLAMVSGQQQPQQPVVASRVAPPPRSPSPPRKSMFENLPPEMKEKNEMFRKEILRRLDIILLEELGADDEEEVEKKPDTKQIQSSEEDIEESSKADSMGAEGSAFRRILSRSSTIGNNSGSPSTSGTTSPSTTSSLSSGPDSPPLEGDPLSTDFLDMLTSVALKHREQSTSEALSAKIVDEAAFTQHFPMVWTGRLALKSTETMINLHLINGSETFLNNVLGRQLNDENSRRDSVKILQRLRLDNGQVEHIYGILTNPEYACCLALSSSIEDLGNLQKNEASLKASFIDYLTKKQIAGISSLDEVDAKFKSARVHVFAPGEIVNKYLSELASSLHDYLQNTDTRYLLIVFTNDKVEPNMDGPPSIASLAVPPLIS
uniref:SPOC domain-containing protein n=1 Tax=Caenorhabditis tropicalis TaxID=1561998 RepID=A0A1I7TFC0_9PELO